MYLASSELERIQASRPETYRRCAELLDPERFRGWVETPFALLPSWLQRGLQEVGRLAVRRSEIRQWEEMLCEAEEAVAASESAILRLEGMTHAEWDADRRITDLPNLDIARWAEANTLANCREALPYYRRQLAAACGRLEAERALLNSEVACV